jgi:peptide/nickel transport system permease protein
MRTLPEISSGSQALEQPTPLPTTGKRIVFGRVFKYVVVRAIVLSAMVVIGVFLAVLAINFGGYIDQIFRSNIDQALTGFAYGGGFRDVPEDQQEALLAQMRWNMEEAYGLHEPFLSRAVRWTYTALTLDWEDSYGLETLYGPRWMRNNTRMIILQRLPNTLLLLCTANIPLFFISIFLALFISKKPGSRLDRLIGTLVPLSSFPSWIIGAVLTAIFAIQLHFFRISGYTARYDPNAFKNLVHDLLTGMALPVMAIFLSGFFQSAYTWRSFFLIHSHEDYVELAKAKGLAAGVIDRRYLIRPTLPFIITNFVFLMINFWQGSLALEAWFNWPGIGNLFLYAIWGNSRSVVMGILVIYAYLLALTVFLLDIIYALVDPRVKVGNTNATVQVARKKIRLRLWPQRKTEFLPRRERISAISPPVAVERQPRQTLAERVQHMRWRFSSLAAFLRKLRTYPSAVAGFSMITILLALTVYTLIAIPPKQAIISWREERPDTYRLPTLAKPTWVNLFRKNDLPETLILNSLQGTADKVVKPAGKDMQSITITFNINYSYKEFPQDVRVRLTAPYKVKQSFATIFWVTPDGREMKLDQFAIQYDNLFSADWFIREKKRNWFVGMGTVPMYALFADPASPDTPAPLQGEYKLRIEGFTFEPDSDINAEVVLLGQVYGLAGTDNKDRDLLVACLWGLPVALAFGLLGAVTTSLATMAFAAVGAWFGGWVDDLIQRFTEINMILPALPIAITVYLVYAKSVWAILGVVILLNIFGNNLKSYRAVFIQAKGAPYIEAAQAYGASHGRIILQYLLPRIASMWVPQLLVLVPSFVFLEATLAFLGVRDIYLPTWGKTIFDAFYSGALEGSLYWVLEPIVLLLFTGLAFTMLGFALDRMLNEREIA